MNTDRPEDAPEFAPIVQALRDAYAMELDTYDPHKPVACKHCGCKLHRTISIKGVPYWAANSGNAFCVWPMQHMRHEVTQ